MVTDHTPAQRLRKPQAALYAEIVLRADASRIARLAPNAATPRHVLGLIILVLRGRPRRRRRAWRRLRHRSPLLDRQPEPRGEFERGLALAVEPTKVSP